MSRRELAANWHVLVVFGFLGALVLLNGYFWWEEQEDDRAERLEVLHIAEAVEKARDTLREVAAAVGTNQDLITANRVLIDKMMSTPAARPLSFNACEGAVLADELRARGSRLPAQEFEKRCDAAAAPP